MHGEGTYIKFFQWRYEGAFKTDDFEGRGKLTYDDGKLFTGEFKKDKPFEGKGTFKDPKTDHTYYGDWKDGHFSGKDSFEENTVEILNIVLFDYE